MPTKPKKMACCSKRAATLKVANFDKAKKAANATSSGSGKKAAPRKAPAKKAKAKPAKGCTICAKK